MQALKRAKIMTFVSGITFLLSAATMSQAVTYGLPIWVAGIVLGGGLMWFQRSAKRQQGLEAQAETSKGELA